MNQIEKHEAGNNISYTLYGCNKCKNGFWHPLKGNASVFYSKDRIAHDMPVLPSIGENHRMFFTLIKKKSGKLLDIGCGDGSFLKAAENKYDVYGIDFDPKIIAIAKHFGLSNVRVMSVYDLPDDNAFDIITFFEVLEHMPDPRAFIEKVKSLLPPGGVIAGSVPYHDKIYPNAKSDMPPHHFLLFSKDGLEYFLKSSGFSEIETTIPYGSWDILRSKSNVTYRTLEKALGINDGTPVNALRYKTYLFIKSFKPILVPIVNVPFRLKYGLMKKDEKEQVGGTLYFQAKI